MKGNIQSVIIDDEKNAREILKALLEEYCPDVDVVGIANSVQSGTDLVKNLKPQLVFLDIDMADGYGFEILQQTDYKSYSVVFTTAYNTYATKAFEFSALHYLLKPINIEALQESVERHKNLKHTITTSQLEILKSGIDDKPTRINFHINNNIVAIEFNDILYLSSEEGTTILHMVDNQVRLLPQSLNFYEELLDESGFYRVHAKYLINLRNIKEYKSQGRLGEVELKDSSRIPISARKKAGFGSVFKDFKG